MRDRCILVVIEDLWNNAQIRRCRLAEDGGVNGGGCSDVNLRDV